MQYTEQALKAKHAANSTIFVLRCVNAVEATDLSTYKSTTIDLSAEQDYTKSIKNALKKKTDSKNKEL
jgi:hypothetical protein